MQLPFFYTNEYTPGQNRIVLDEVNSRHIIQVLRMQAGQMLHITNGQGYLLTATISDPHKKYCEIAIVKMEVLPSPPKKITIAISLLKNANRFEWFLEKATEIGVAEVIPLICERTEKQKVKTERQQSILVSAMLQSRRAWLPQIGEPVKFADFINKEPWRHIPRKLIAHCMEHDKFSLMDQPTIEDAIILIGPEGDFTTNEISTALQAGYKAVTLGETRLRTETAGVVAASLMIIR